MFWRYAVAGAVIALLGAALGRGVVDYLAQRALPPGTVMPASFLARAVWAWQGLTAALYGWGGSLRDLADAVGPILVLALLGAGLGAVVYLYRTDFFTRSHHRHSSRRSRRRGSR